jgi:hypothetical protein
MVETHISPKGINRGGFLQNHAAVDGDNMAVHNVGSTERRANGGMAELVNAS